jgi:hypothetical protein
MLIKKTALTEALRDRLEAAGIGRTLEVFQRGIDIYVGAEVTGEEQVEVISLCAAHAAESFGGPTVDLLPPDGYTLERPYGKEFLSLREARGSTHDCAWHSISHAGELKTSGGENGDTMPPEVWQWLTSKWIQAKIGPMAKEA